MALVSLLLPSPSMRSIQPISLPDWLSKVQDPSHVQLALKTLHQREEARTRACLVSLHSTTKRLRSILESIPEDLWRFYSAFDGHSPENTGRNRYHDVVPYDRTRVVVDDTGQGCSGTKDTCTGRYVNSNWVLERFGGKWWIATQAPLPNTAHTFLSLIQNYVTPPSQNPAKSKIRTVVQLTQNLEGNRRKAHPYFSEVVGESITISPEGMDLGPPFQVTLIDQESFEESRCIKSTISFKPISNGATTNGAAHSGVTTFQHLLFYAWPDQGVPETEDRDGLLSFCRLVDNFNRQLPYPDADPDPPIIVGCSAGIGRTGSFITMSSLLRAYGYLQPPAYPTDPASVLKPSPLGELPEALQDDMVAQEVDSLREQRSAMVQRPEQFMIVYEILVAALTSGSSSR